MIVFRTQHDNVDHETAELAIESVEKRGFGSVIKFALYPNLPGRLPTMVGESCALWTYENKKWRSHYIFDGIGGPIHDEKPS